MQFDFGSENTVVRVNVPDAPTLMTQVGARFTAHQGFALATINLDHLVKLASSAHFRAAYAAQDFVVADGNPIVWLSQLARRPVSLVPGSDMVLPLIRMAVQSGVSVALLGSTETALKAAAKAIESQVPGVKIAACIAPAMGFDPDGAEAAQILANLNKAEIGLCLIALGAPKQEILAARGRALAPKTGFASIGAGLDFLAGTQTRAPAFARALALEWLWRAMSSPRRMVPRYWACAKILPAQIAAALRLRKS